jgi:lipopolysaccharide exporter
MPYRRKIAAFQERLARALPRSDSFLRNALTLATGTTISQIITLAALPVLTRLYTPSDFGLLAAFTVLCTIISTLACLGYEPAIVLPKRNGTALCLWVLCIQAGLLVTATSAIIFTIWPAEISELAGNAELAEVLQLVPLVVFAWSVTVATTQWCTRHREFSAISASNVANRSTAVVGQFSFGILPSIAGSLGLIMGFVIGSLAGMSVLLQHLRKTLQSRLWNSLRLSRVLVIVYCYRDYPGYGLSSNLIGAMVRALPVFSLGYFFSAAAVGHFALANQLVAAPVQLVTSSIVDVFFERAKRAHRDGDLAAVTARIYGLLISLLMTPLALLSISAPELISLLLGDEWLQAGVYIRWLAIWFFSLSAITPLFRIFLVLNRQKELAVINVISLVVSAAALLVGGLYGDATETIIWFCIGSALVRTGEALRVMHITGNRMQLVAELPIKELIKSLPLILPMLVAYFITDHSLIISGLFLLLLGIFGATRLKSIIAAAG